MPNPAAAFFLARPVMCGRYTLKTPAKAVADYFGLSDPPSLTPRYNIAPTQAVATVRAEEAGRKLVLLRWGLVPSWADDPKIGCSLINARAETAASKPAFRSAFRHRRCLILADGFYEWKKAGTKKQPYFFSMREGQPFAFAGLWERWEKGQEPMESCTVLTTAANETVKPLHDRMPVILSPKDYDQWLDSNAQGIVALLKPYADAAMKAFPVSTLVNKPSNDDPKCIEPLAS